MLPRRLKIHGHTYHVNQVPEKLLPDDTAADVDPNTNTIRVMRQSPPSRKLVLLLHEALHALVIEDRIPQEERVVSLFAEHIVQLMRDNPSLVRHILGMCRK